VTQRGSFAKAENSEEELKWKQEFSPNFIWKKIKNKASDWVFV
jgi:hypothetical protein